MFEALGFFFFIIGAGGGGQAPGAAAVITRIGIKLYHGNIASIGADVVKKISTNIVRRIGVNLYFFRGGSRLTDLAS